MPSPALQIETEDGLDIIVREDVDKPIWQEWQLDTVHIRVNPVEVGSVLGLEPAQLQYNPGSIVGVRVFQLRDLVAAQVEITPEIIGTIMPIDAPVLTIRPDEVRPLLPLDVVPVLLRASDADLLLVPDAPTGFSAKRVNDFADTELSWNAAFGAADYVIYRNDNHRAGYYLHDTTANTSYTDTHGHTYQNHGYKVAARTSAGVLSGFMDAIHTSGKNANL